MSNKFVVMASSAISDRSKHNILVADLLRVMRCVSPHCDPSERQRHVQEFLYRMQISGYNQEQRVLVYKATKSKYDQQMKNHHDKIALCTNRNNGGGHRDNMTSQPRRITGMETNLTESISSKQLQVAN